MDWIDYKKAHDMVPHSCILESLILVGVATNLITFLERSMAHWKTTLTARGKEESGRRRCDVNITRGIFQGDSLSPLLIVIAMILMTSLLRHHKAGYNLHTYRPNHLLFMDHLKDHLCSKSEREMESLLQTVRLFTEDMKMELGIEKCATLSMRKLQQSSPLFKWEEHSRSWRTTGL